MSALVLVLSMVAAESPEATSVARPIAFHEYQRQISDLFKLEVKAAKQSPERAAAVRQMCALHAQIVRDERYETSDTLQEYRTRLWSRLRRVKAGLKKQLARAGNDLQDLNDLTVFEQADPLSVATADTLAQSLSLLDQAQGGPGVLLAYGGGAVTPDHGRELVELIERTINPAFWDTSGGPGTIVYYRPLMCLVVRATAEVHGNVGGVLGGLRKAGR